MDNNVFKPEFMISLELIERFSDMIMKSKKMEAGMKISIDDLLDFRKLLNYMIEKLQKSKEEFNFLFKKTMHDDKYVKAIKTGFDNSIQRNEGPLLPLGGVLKRAKHGRGQNDQKMNSVRSIVLHPVWKEIDKKVSSLPSDNVIYKLFSQEPLQKQPQNTPKERWYAKLSRIPANFQSKKGIVFPSESELFKSTSYYYSNRTPDFSIESAQREGINSFQRLLSCLIEISNIRRKEIPNPRPHYFKNTPTLPCVKHDPYLSLDFKARLNIELKSLSLDLEDSQKQEDFLPFEKEINEGIKEANEILIPKIEGFRKMIFGSLEKFRQIEQKRKARMDTFLKLFNERNTK